MLDDKTFIDKINDISRQNGLVLPFLTENEHPSSEFLSGWARFLEICVKSDIRLSDPRWRRVSVHSNRPHTRFVLEGDPDVTADPDFRVGLQLLMGTLGDHDNDLT